MPVLAFLRLLRRPKKGSTNGIIGVLVEKVGPAKIRPDVVEPPALTNIQQKEKAPKITPRGFFRSVDYTVALVPLAFALDTRALAALVPCASFVVSIALSNGP